MGAPLVLSNDLLPGKVFNKVTEVSQDDLMWLQDLELNRVLGGRAMSDTIWRCDQMRAGRLYNRMMFDTREEAERFVEKMQRLEPDQVFSVEAVEAKMIWN
jgi:hypothetical protein